MARLRVGLLLALLAALAACARQDQATSPPLAMLTLTHAEAVPSGWNATAPPATGWVPVKLMDHWNTRWPRHDGVVWYRVGWNQARTDVPVGLLLDYVCMADAVWLNGSLLHRDPHLSEPLSRSWIAPQYFLVDRPLLRAGENTLLVRVSGLAAYAPGFGTVRVGDADRIRAEYQSGLRWRYRVRLFNFAISAVLGVLFGMIWLLRRKDTVYGWYALTTLFGAGYSWNYITSSPWPFDNTDAWQAFVVALLMASVWCFALFLLRFCGSRWPRTEAALGLASAAAFAMALVAPHLMGPWRNLWVLPAILIYYVMIVVFLWHAARSRRIELRVLGASLLLPLLLSFHDLAVYLEWIHDNNYIGALTSPLTLIGMGFAIAWRFSAAMRRVEGFNAELRHEVDVATTRLSETLSREHALALANTRIGERLNLVRDLHDGFGGSLLGAIAALEQSPPSPEATRTVATLKELRDDLRLVIDTATHEQGTDLVGLLAPLRHSWSQRLEAADIDSDWQFDGLDDCRFGAARSLDLLRFLQEALTNVLKHSGARRVEVQVRSSGDRLQAVVRDDGHGFDPANHGAGGVGLASLHNRAMRLGGTFDLRSAPDRGATVSLELSSLSS